MSSRQLFLLESRVLRACGCVRPRQVIEEINLDRWIQTAADETSSLTNDHIIEDYTLFSWNLVEIERPCE